ncbi:MAG: hypothetical protein AUK55_13445 [Syntrophobacteraceae bacterium CG2_30_61_12]|nr:MAG: hypothetical protein AUK55_13445 [Syntrophobacteraceae bacterium CG2_30_61_12]PIU31055.1 MAG: hypothetical protein COT06_10220 [Syntrophobacteraceae bacterium CG07_land_8_20_14_0_80_61_8]
MTAEQAPVLIGGTDLENGLHVEFHDASRIMAGDRMQVTLLIRVPLKAVRAHFSDCAQPDAAYLEFIEFIGEDTAFEQRKVRNFVDRREAPEVLRELREEFMRSNRSYLSLGYFEKRSILRKYRVWLEQHR